jgi:hypothetical protein
MVDEHQLVTTTVGRRPDLYERKGAIGRALASRVGVTAALAVGTAGVGIGNPHEGGFFPQCVFYEATGHWCPGCGGLRAVHDLLHGDLAGALSMNAVITLLVVPLGVVGLAWWWLEGLGVSVPRLRVSTRAAWLLPALLAVFWVVRNVPALEPYLAP